MADPERGSNTRFLVITIAVVVLILGGLFFWFMGRDTWISGASVYDSEDTLSASGVLPVSNTESSAVATSGSSSSSSASQEISTMIPGILTGINTDMVPVIKRDIQAEDMEIRFSNLNTNIKVNKESLQLDALKEVKLKIHSFVGNMVLNERTVSLAGKVSRLEVNGVVLSSEEMQITFDGLDYEYFAATGINIEQVNLANTNGKLDLSSGKIIYDLENKDKVTLNQVSGNLVADKTARYTFSADVVAQDIATAGSIYATFK